MTEYTAEEMMKRWFLQLRTARRRGVYAWVAVKECFAVGSTMAQQICRTYGHNPDEMVRKFYR